VKLENDNLDDITLIKRITNNKCLYRRRVRELCQRCNNNNNNKNYTKTSSSKRRKNNQYKFACGLKEHNFFINRTYNLNDLDSININEVYQRRDNLLVQTSSINEKIQQYKQEHMIFASTVENLLESEKYSEALDLLAKRPGIFSRRLDELLSKVNDNDKVLQIFETIAPKVSVKVLLSLKGYFQKRHEKLKCRVFLLKGSTSKLYLTKNVKEVLDLELCKKITHICEQALMSHFEGKTELKKVYISEELKRYLIPLDIRNSNSALETYSKGSRFALSFKQLTNEEKLLLIKDIEERISKNNKVQEDNCLLISELKDALKNEQENEEEKNKEKNELLSKVEKMEIKNNIDKLIKENIKLEDIVKKDKEELDNYKSSLNKKEMNNVRLFIWWTNMKDGSRIDIDLSVMIYNQDLKNIGRVSYTQLVDEDLKIYHSGDIRDGGSVDGIGAAEFIDFNPEYLLSKGARYIAVNVISFNGLHFNQLDHCHFGWMERESLKSNELFEPKTVRQKLDLNCNNTSTTPIIFDCETREIIWVDVTMTENDTHVAVENYTSSLQAILYYYLNPLKDNLYNLFDMHVKSRNGNLVESEEELSEGDTAFVTCLPYKCIEGVNYICPTDLDIILSEYMTSCSA